MSSLNGDRFYTLYHTIESILSLTFRLKLLLDIPYNIYVFWICENRSGFQTERRLIQSTQIYFRTVELLILKMASISWTFQILGIFKVIICVRSGLKTFLQETDTSDIRCLDAFYNIYQWNFY